MLAATVWVPYRRRHCRRGRVALENGQFGNIDVEGKRLRDNKRISAGLTIKGDQVVWDRNGLSHEDWDKR